MTITGPRLNLYSWCDRISFSIKLFGPFWHVKGVIFGEYFLTFTSHLSLISRWQRHRSPGPHQDTHRNCWTLSSSCTARCPPRTWTASSSTPAWRRSRISLMQIHFQKLLRMDTFTYPHMTIVTWIYWPLKMQCFLKYSSFLVPLGILAAMEGPRRLLRHICVQFFRFFNQRILKSEVWN